MFEKLFKKEQEQIEAGHKKFDKFRDAVWKDYEEKVEEIKSKKKKIVSTNKTLTKEQQKYFEMGWDAGQASIRHYLREVGDETTWYAYDSWYNQ